MSVHAGQRAGRAIRDVPRTKNTAGTSRSMESSKPSGAQQPQLPAAGAQRRRQHLSWPRSMRRCHARQWLAAELQPAHEPRRRQSAAVRASAVKRGRLRGVAAATDGALSTNRDNLYFLMLSCFDVPMLRDRASNFLFVKLSPHPSVFLREVRTLFS